MSLKNRVNKPKSKINQKQMGKAMQALYSEPKNQTSAWVATIKPDGSVKLSNQHCDDIYLKDRENLYRFMLENGIIERETLIVEIVKKLF